MGSLREFFGIIMKGFGFADVIDIVIVAFLVYQVLRFIRETRAEQLAKGVLVFFIVTLGSLVFDLYTLHWILSNVMTVGLIAIVVLFQPEIRRALERMGRSKFTTVFSQVDKDEAKRIIGEFCRAIESMSDSKTGALIVIERETQLNEIVETGTVIDAKVSEQLIGNIFYEGSPLHDGAMIVRGNRLRAAGCVLPLTQNKELNKALGTRHRAGIGITENSDALSIIVSEETGVISMAEQGKLTRFLDAKAIEKTLLNIYMSKDTANPVKENLFRATRAIKGVTNVKK